MDREHGPLGPPLAPPLVELRGVSVTRGGTRLLGPLDFCLEPGARWAVLGENGAGKTSFLRLVRGEVLPDAGGERVYDFPGALPGEGGPQPTPLGLRQRLALVSGDMQDAFAVHNWAATGLDVVLSGFGDGPLLYSEPQPAQLSAAVKLLDALSLSGLSGRRMARLSTGEGRKLLLARALVSGPDVLVLDEGLEGLDAPARREFLALLDSVASTDPRLAVLFATHRLDELPGCLTKALVLQTGRVSLAGPLDEVLTALRPSRPNAADALPLAAARAAQALAGPEFLARITSASVDVEGARLLHEVDWTIRPGEHWAVQGPNGAGKSTLLLLLAGQVWPSAVDGPPGMVEYGFAAPDGNLDDARRRIGFVSASLQATFPYDLRVEEAVATGLDNSLDVFALPNPAGRARCAALLDFFGLAELAARRVRSLSRGQLRRVLLARALAGNPALLVLDEPMAGLDAKARELTRERLDALAAQGLPLVLVTHHQADLPGQINHVLALRSGRVVFCGKREAYGDWKAARRAGRLSPKN